MTTAEVHGTTASNHGCKQQLLAECCLFNSWLTKQVPSTMMSKITEAPTLARRGFLIPNSYRSQRRRTCASIGMQDMTSIYGTDAPSRPILGVELPPSTALRIPEEPPQWAFSVSCGGTWIGVQKGLTPTLKIMIPQIS